MIKKLIKWWQSRTQAHTWEEVKAEILRSMIQIEALKPKTDYREILQVNVPTRFYWNPDGTFDGIEFGPFVKELMPWEEDMMTQCLNAIAPAMGVKKAED